MFKLDVHHGGSAPLPLDDQQMAIIEKWIDDILAGGDKFARLNSLQCQQAKASMMVISEYLTGLALGQGGQWHVDQRAIAKATGLNLKRIQKWMPKLCGDTLPKTELSTGPSYTGTLFLRTGRADHNNRRAQEYILSPIFAAALGFPVQAIKVPAA